MEYKVYNVIAEWETEVPDIDGIYHEDFEQFFSDTYSSKVSAIRKAQKLASKYICYVRVIEVVISEKGMTFNKTIYRKH